MPEQVNSNPVAPPPPGRKPIHKAITSRFTAFKRTLVIELWVNTILSSRFIPWRPRRAFLRLWGMKIGDGTVISPGCRFGSPKMTIGSNCALRRMEYDGDAPVSIGNESAIGADVRFTTRTHELGNSARRRAYVDIDKPITVGSGVWIPQRSVLMPGVSVADGCVIAPGAIVTASTEPNGLYAGVPARRIRDLGE